MNPENLTALSDEELLQKIKKIKSNIIIDGLTIGFVTGIVIYSAVKNGFGFFTFFILVVALIIIGNSTKNKILENKIRKEIISRNL